MSERHTEIATDVVAAVSLIASLFKSVSQIVALFEKEDLTEDEVQLILQSNRASIASRIENKEVM